MTNILEILTIALRIATVDATVNSVPVEHACAAYAATDSDAYHACVCTLSTWSGELHGSVGPEGETEAPALPLRLARAWADRGMLVTRTVAGCE